jgi:hypothetical protein
MGVVKTVRRTAANCGEGSNTLNADRSAPTRGARVFGVLGFLALAAAAWSREAPAQLPGPTQYDVQSVYLIDLAKFVRWPVGSEHNVITICVVGPKGYTESLTKFVAGERIGGRPIAVRTIQTPEEEEGCNILFIGAAVTPRLDRLLAAAANKPVLTVSDIPGFLDRDGMIQLVMVGNRVRFSVNLRPVARSGLSLSSEFLKLAVKVSGAGDGGGER